MASVTYRNQPAIDKTGGSVPVAGTSHPYTVGAILWPGAVEQWIEERLVGSTLHVCCGMSRLGDVRLDLFADDVDVRADAAKLPFADNSFDTVLIDPPYSGKFQWNHDMLNELHRVAQRRIIFQHWYSPVNTQGKFKKAHVYTLSDSAAVPYMPDKDLSGAKLAMLVDDQWIVVEEEVGGKEFHLEQQPVYWQPRTYFGRVQIISVLDRSVEV